MIEPTDAERVEARRVIHADPFQADIFAHGLAHARYQAESKPPPTADALSWGGGRLYLEAGGDPLCRIEPALLHKIVKHVGTHGATATPLLDGALNEAISDHADPPPGWSRYMVTDDDGCQGASLHVHRDEPSTVTVQEAWAIYRREAKL